MVHCCDLQGPQRIEELLGIKRRHMFPLIALHGSSTGGAIRLRGGPSARRLQWFSRRFVEITCAWREIANIATAKERRKHLTTSPQEHMGVRNIVPATIIPLIAAVRHLLCLRTQLAPPGTRNPTPARTLAPITARQTAGLTADRRANVIASVVGVLPVSSTLAGAER